MSWNDFLVQSDRLIQVKIIETALFNTSVTVIRFFHDHHHIITINRYCKLEVEYWLNERKAWIMDD